MLNLWNFYVIGPMSWGLNEVATLTGSYGIAIIVFTVFIKLVLYPLTVKQLKSQRAQQALQPQLQELRARYGNDKVKLNEETMRLYKENNANPIAGCLPTLIQFPILIGLYNALYAVIRQPAVHASLSFLWVKNLAYPDFWNAGPDHTFNGIFLLPVLAGALQWVQQRMMMNPAANQDPQQKMMTQMMQFMPLMVIFFGYRFPAGLAVYWVTNTLVSIVQAYFITGFGSLVTLVPALHRIGSPRLVGGIPPALVDRGTPPRDAKAAPTAERKAPAAAGKGDGRAAVKRAAAVDTTAQAGRNGVAGSQNGQVKHGPGQPGQRKTGPEGSRSRPAARRQGSKR